MAINENPSVSHILGLKPHGLSSEKVLTELQSKESGLNSQKVNERLIEFGPNSIPEKKSYSLLSLLIGQFTDFLVILLIVAGIVSWLIGEKIDAIAILTIIAVNGILGFIQEFQAERSIEALKKIETLEARVVREGHEQTIPAENVVPGDILVLYEGERIPADARLLEVHSLEVDESLLTGESIPVVKETDTLEENIALADRKNMVFSSSIITKGRGIAVAVLTGVNTEIGKIATEIQEAPTLSTPLQNALDKLGKTLGMICLGVVVPGFIWGIISGRDIIEMIVLAISLAVSAIPEGLPIVVTIALALGIRRMAKVNVLIRRLSAAESLGGVDVICSDKTGTITYNQMTATKVFMPEEGFFSISGSGYSTDGTIVFDEETNNKYKIKTNNDGLEKVHDMAKELVLASDATIDFGDPTERALIVALHKFKDNADRIRQLYKRVDEIPFDSATKYMAVKIKDRKEYKAIVKGAPEVIFSMCSLKDSEINKYSEINEYLSGNGLRVLAIAKKIVNEKSSLKETKNYEFVGLIGLYDPPREEVAESINLAHSAGIRVIMITGDHKKTAESIAERIGLKTIKVITGEEIEQMSNGKFAEVVSKVNVFARVSPSHKVRVLTTLQSMGFNVAMTGDGVNDAAAVKRANIGISLGAGTDLTKSVSDVILLDNDFSSIPKGIREGRRIFFNIKKFVRFLLSANFDEIGVIFTSIVTGIPLPFLPLHILWLNLATDSLPALALTNDVAEKDIMERKPYKPQEEIMKGVIPFSLLAAFIAYISSLGIFLLTLYGLGFNVAEARTMSFTTTVFFEFFLVFAIRSPQSAFKIGLFTNKLLWLAIFVGVIGQLWAIYSPLGQQIFETYPLTISDWGLVFIFASLGFVVLEVLKLIKSVFPKTGKYIPIA
jgi:Ca2+-transporting ATPase